LLHAQDPAKPRRESAMSCLPFVIDAQLLPRRDSG
jgi:hypothetical protein